ncbi:hypothetical protein BH10PSE10_BH10PSE10_08140 [soil metagenome]
MPSKPSSRPVKKPAAKKAARKTIVRKTVKKVVTNIAVKKTAAEKSASAKAVPEKPARRPRAKVINEHPGNLVADPHDHVAVEAIEKAATKLPRTPRVPRRTAVDIAADPPPGKAPSGSMVARVSEAIERELSKIERIVGNPLRMAPAQRIETESRARVLASLARTLKEVMRLREQERAGDDTTKAADDDVPRDLDEFRRELSRRLEGLVACRAPLPAGGHDLG